LSRPLHGFISQFFFPFHPALQESPALPVVLSHGQAVLAPQVAALLLFKSLGFQAIDYFFSPTIPLHFSPPALFALSYTTWWCLLYHKSLFVFFSLVGFTRNLPLPPRQFFPSSTPLVFCCFLLCSPTRDCLFLYGLPTFLPPLYGRSYPNVFSRALWRETICLPSCCCRTKACGPCVLFFFVFYRFLSTLSFAYPVPFPFTEFPPFPC